MNLWMPRSDGQPSASITFAAIAFGVTTLWLLLSIFEKIGPIPIRPFSSGDAMAYLAPILALYFGRRFTETQVGVKTKKNNSSKSGSVVVKSDSDLDSSTSEDVS